MSKKGLCELNCPECNKRIKLIISEKMSHPETVFYRLETIPQALDFCDYKEYKEPTNCIACGDLLGFAGGFVVCKKCEIKYGIRDLHTG